MKNILIINGHEAYPHARGQLNHTIFTAMADKLGEKYEVKKNSGGRRLSNPGGTREIQVG